MTETLAEKTLRASCRWRNSPLIREAAEIFRAQAPEWTLEDDAHRIERAFRFKNFREALAFVQQVGESRVRRPSSGHKLRRGYANVSLRTKKIKGLHENDFIMAAIDLIVERTDD